MTSSRSFFVMISSMFSLLLIVTNMSYAQDKTPEKVAILPFTWAEDANESVKEKHPDAPELARRVFYNAFSTTGYDEVPMGTVDQLLSPSDIKNQDFSVLEENGIDGVIQAEIHHIAIGKGGIISRSNAEIDFTMINLKTDQVIWSNKETVSRMGGILLNSGQLTRAFDSLSVTEDEKSVEITNVLLELYMSVLENIPPAEVSLKPPMISSTRFVMIEEQAPNQPAGLEIWLEGSAGCSAYFDLPSGFEYIPFIEYVPGNYYTFFPTDEVPASITVHLENGLGILSTKQVTPSFPEEIVKVEVLDEFESE